ncbi:MAG: hypothetical protein LBL59_06960 [Xanthomonadaceae bacterium]|jgi:hypothetical protein|nr:hypothetical protein [Xanthomonadaceae bacterium]
MRKSLWILLLVTLAAILATTASASGRRQSRQLTQAQESFAVMLRWGEFEDAWQMLDPEYREAHPMTELEINRYQQVRVSRYRPGTNSRTEDGSVIRMVEIGVINVHTQAERRIRYREQWRWDPSAKRWWQTGGLPDFWAGE